MGPRILFVADGVMAGGSGGADYRGACRDSVAAILRVLNLPQPDWTLCFLPGPLPGPALEPDAAAEAARAGRDRMPLVIVPLGFVTDRVETRHDIAMALRQEATAAGVPHVVTVPVVATDPDFIAGLANLVRDAVPPGS